MPLDYELRTGDSVDILTSKAQGEGPSQDWLQFVATPRARNKIRQWFARGRREDALEHGRDAVQRVMRKQHLPIKRLATEEAMQQVADDLKYPNLEALYVAVGEGHVSPQSVVARLSRLVSGTTDEDVHGCAARAAGEDRHAGRLARASSSRGSPTSGCGSAAAARRCPGIEIIGFVTRGQGVSVHRTDCPNVSSRSAGSPNG